MAKVLLALDGDMPAEKALKYAASLCRRMSAGLAVLHIVRDEAKGSFAKAKSAMKKIKMQFEGAMLAATYAESGEHDTAKRIIETTRKRIAEYVEKEEISGMEYIPVTGKKEPPAEIMRYVSENSDVVVAVYARCKPAGKGTKKAGSDKSVMPGSILEDLDVPLVVVGA